MAGNEVDQNMCGIYAIVNLKNHKIYVGSSRDIHFRWKTHVRKAKVGKHFNPHFQRAWNLYGEDMFRIMIIETCSIEELEARENYWIQTTESFNRDFGYNNSAASNSSMDPEVAKKISIALKGRKKPDHVLAAAHAASPFQKGVALRKGAKHTDATKEKLRQSRLGTKASEETKAKMRLAQQSRRSA